MPTYKTPGVYVEEISVFPPSVAEVETAIPAFIGYTEKATEHAPNDLMKVPTKITSLLEYEELFGGAAPVDVTSVTLDETNTVIAQEVDSTFYLYDSLRMFFKNGGGKCYIVSVGLYEDKAGGNEEKDDFNHASTGGLKYLKKVDEPTMIVIPDAVLFDDDGIYDIQKSALNQCNALGDRVAIFDLLESKSSDATFDWEDGVNDFRDNIGINYLKYGAAYTPWLKTNLGIDVHYRDVAGKISRGGNTVTLDTLVDDADAKLTVTAISEAVADVDTIATDLDTLAGASDTVKARFQALVDTFNGTSNDINLEAMFSYLYDIAVQVEDWIDNLTYSTLTTDITNYVTNTLQGIYEDLMELREEADADGDMGAYSDWTTEGDNPNSAGWGTIWDAAPAASSLLSGDLANKLSIASAFVRNAFTQINTVLAAISSSASTYETTLEATLLDSHPTFKGIIRTLSNSLTVLPPSGAMAGIYAAVDADRGVWKAPANVSVNGVVGLTETIDNLEQDDLNVDVNGGKSINAIRAFTGRGTLVWGARTLAGNDNEWRYISVRRFFNMVEESVMKSTHWAVFEPNDANTWIKVKSMIENYLTLKWREGALQGAKPDQAFFVNVGLGSTMTAQDILEGRMNVEIGMAVVRPAEFIILKFSHKLPEA